MPAIAAAHIAEEFETRKPEFTSMLNDVPDPENFHVQEDAPQEAESN